MCRSFFSNYDAFDQVKYRENWTLKDLPKPSVDANRCASEALTHAHVTNAYDAKFNHDEVSWVNARAHVAHVYVDRLTGTKTLARSRFSCC